MILHVAGGEHAGNGGGGGIAFAAALGDDIAVLHVELADEEIGVGLVADGDEYAHELDILAGAALDVLDAHAGDAGLVAQHLVERRNPT